MPQAPSHFESDGLSLSCGDSLSFCQDWDPPTAIIVDGPYGIDGYPGDLREPHGLGEWYEPHIQAWTRSSLPETTLWFWNTEVGWANVHPVLEANGWEYVNANIWDKGVGHIAGNVNGNSIRRFPVVSEICVQYVRRVELQSSSGESVEIKSWLRSEWKRSGLPLSRTNEACGVKNAATRKYFTQCHLWYFPPPEMIVKLAAYAHQHGEKTTHPYFSLDGKTPITEKAWSKLRAKWNHEHGVTNVWSEPAVRGAERVKTGTTALHSNQKPLKLIDRIVSASSDPGDVVWDPFSGLATTAVVAHRGGRRFFGAEITPEVFEAAKARLNGELATPSLDIEKVA